MSTTSAIQSLIELSLLHSAVQRRLGGPLSAHGISFTDFMVLSQLSQCPQQRSRRVDLAEAVGLSASGVTRLLNPLQKIGLVSKEDNPRDARVSLVTLTAAGRRVLAESEQALRPAADALLDKLSTRQREEFSRALSSLRS